MLYYLQILSLRERQEARAERKRLYRAYLNKTWSVFSMCSEQEMNDVLSILDKELESSITFNETLIFIVGHKNSK